MKKYKRYKKDYDTVYVDLDALITVEEFLDNKRNKRGNK